MRNTNSPPLRSLTALLFLGSALACESSVVPPAIATPEVVSSVNKLEAGLGRELNELRRLTAPYHNLEKAKDAGYTVPATPCWYHGNMGAMGYHFANPAYIDGQANLLEPELVMYEPNAAGHMRFVALEYIVPIGAWLGTDPPQLLGKTFARNDDLGLYVLHIWLWRDNPDGIFADWNPKVSCKHAAESENRG